MLHTRCVFTMLYWISFVLTNLIDFRSEKYAINKNNNALSCYKEHQDNRSMQSLFSSIKTLNTMFLLLFFSSALYSYDVIFEEPVMYLSYLSVQVRSTLRSKTKHYWLCTPNYWLLQDSVIKILDTLYHDRNYARFFVLETIARVPYFGEACCFFVLLTCMCCISI